MDEKEFDQMLDKYADVIVNIGLGLKKDQVLFINGILEDAPFARAVAKSAYKTGAKYVDMMLTR
ncbi:MAG TPA: aminopeptidase [Anaerolineales bacterium]|nr:aminopeptidase [Anaerolineales bacterium]